MANIDDFKANLIGGGARANQFRVTITPPAGIAIGLDVRRTSFLVTAAAIPAIEMNFFEVPFRGRVINYPGDRPAPADWTTTFYNDTDFMIRNAMERWQNAINDLDSGRGVNNTLDYCADLTVSQLDRDDVVIKVYKFVNAWPQAIAAIDLSSASATEIESFAVTFRYQHFLASDVNDGGEFAIE